MLFCIQLLVFFTSCKKELPIDAAVIAQQLVVEGYIEQGRYPRVYLTKTSPYFQTIDSAAMWKLLGSVGKVTVATANDTEVLTLRSNFKQFPPFYFEGTEIKGKVGEEYHLKVELHGKVYTATTTITPPVPLSHLEVKTNPIDASKKYFLIRFLDFLKTLLLDFLSILLLFLLFKKILFIFICINNNLFINGAL